MNGSRPQFGFKFSGSTFTYFFTTINNNHFIAKSICFCHDICCDNNCLVVIFQIPNILINPVGTLNIYAQSRLVQKKYLWIIQ